jgi:Fe-S cluster assembly iron-binding protein IscA
MLAISQEAATAINGIVSNSQAPEGAGLRVSPQLKENQPAALELSVVEAPAGGDQVVEDQGAQVFVDEQIAPVLDDKLLDATIEADGVHFVIIDQGATSPTA